MDPNYSFSILSFFIGVAAGFQGVYERYQQDSLRASFTLPGLFYLVSRGVAPAAVFLSLYINKYIEANLFLQSLACGTGFELVLRTRFFVKQSTKGGNVEELSKGPFDLLRWYQSLWLEKIALYLATSRKAFIEGVIPKDVDFQVLMTRASNNVGAWPDQNVINDLTQAIQRLDTEFQSELASGRPVPAAQIKYKLKLAYLLLSKVGRKGVKTLLS